MDLNEVHENYNYIRSKLQGRWDDPQEVDRVLHLAQLDLMEELLASFENKQVDTDALRRFKKTATVALTAGVGTLPTDYRYLTTQAVTAAIRTQMVTDGEWHNAINSPGCPPTSDFVFCRLIGTNQIEVRPTSVASIDIDYISLPVPPVWDFTLAANNIDLVYNQGGSTQLEWPDHEIRLIIRKALGYAGISEREADLQQFEFMKEKADKGQ